MEVLNYRDGQLWRSRLEEKPAAFVAYLGARRWVVERTFLAEPGTPPEQGLRAAAQDGRSHDLRGDEPGHASQADAGSMRGAHSTQHPYLRCAKPSISACTKNLPAITSPPVYAERSVEHRRSSRSRLPRWPRKHILRHAGLSGHLP
jgi:hypothetical protein